jgi:hypothetical protein
LQVDWLAARKEAPQPNENNALAWLTPQNTPFETKREFGGASNRAGACRLRTIVSDEGHFQGLEVVR